MEEARPEIVSEDRTLEKAIEKAFGAAGTLYTVVHHTRKFEVPVMTVKGKPERELSSLATVGLWRTPVSGGKLKENQRIELVGVFETAREGCREALAAAAFRVMRTGKAFGPGTVLLNCLHDWYPKATVPHFYFVQAQRWGFAQLQPVKMGALEVVFLEVLPVTEGEVNLLNELGPGALESKLLGASVSLWDLKRPSAV